jgi:hypothetical protein
MRDYHKIQTVWERDPKTKHRTLIEGKWANEIFGYLANNRWVFEEKVDGTNVRVIIPKQEGTNFIRYGGKTDTAQLPTTLTDALQTQFLPLGAQLYEMFPNGASLYGEGYGARIQKGGGNYRSDQGFALFDVLVKSDDNREWWLSRENVNDIASKLKLVTCPIIGYGTLHEMIEMTKHGFTSRWGDFLAEGIVARPEVELQTRSGERVITKIKRKDFQFSSYMRKMINPTPGEPASEVDHEKQSVQTSPDRHTPTA